MLVDFDQDAHANRNTHPIRPTQWATERANSLGMALTRSAIIGSSCP